MYFRKREVANDLLASHSRGNLRLLGSNGFLVKGKAIDNHKSWQEISICSAKKKDEKEIGIIAKSKKKSSKDIAVSKPFSPGLKVEIVNKTARQQEGNNSQINITSDAKLCSRELRSPQSGFRLLRNQRESKLYQNLCTKYEDEAQDGAESANFYIKRLEFPIQKRHVTKLRRQTSPDILPAVTSSENPQEMTEKEKGKRIEDKMLWGDEACQQNMMGSARAYSAKVRDKKAMEIYGKRYSVGSVGKLKALHCALSRRSQSVDQTIEDEDYQKIDYEYLLKFKTVSRLSRICDNSVIDAVAKENSMNAVETLSLPPVLGSKWKLKDRYVSELSFNPPTPVLREYTRISQARVVDFSDLALGSQVL